jgi:hypothetical protein
MRCVSKEGAVRRCHHCWHLLVGFTLLSLALLQSIPARGRAAPLWVEPQATEPLLCPSALTFGLATQCAIDAADEHDAYSFTAAANDKVKIRIQVITGALDPAIHVYSPTNAKLCEAFTSQVFAEITNCTLPVAGNYMLVVDDTYSTKTGQYLLYAQRLNNPDNAQPLGFGQTLTDTLQFVAEFSTYTMAAQAEAKVKIRMTRLDGSFYPQMWVYSPTGTKLCSTFSSGSSAEISSCTLPSTGLYTILAEDIYVSGIGSYTMELTCLNEQCRLSSTYLPLVIGSPP